jgi:Fe-S cluster assembly ATP-binding protein
MMLKLDDVSVSIGGKKILDGVSHSFGKGVYAVMGPNGSGKSTLAKAIMGMQGYEGSIFFGNEKVDKLSIDKRARLGIFLLFQHTPHLPGISLLDIAKGVFKGKTLMEIMDMLENAAERAGLKPEYITKPIDRTWSGGELKKAEIVQMLVLKPKLVVSDEIDAGVDVDSLERIIGAIRESGAETVIFISHIPATVEKLAPDKVVVMKHGKFVAEGGKELLEKVKKEGYGGF